MDFDLNQSQTIKDCLSTSASTSQHNLLSPQERTPTKQMRTPEKTEKVKSSFPMPFKTPVFKIIRNFRPPSLGSEAMANGKFVANYNRKEKSLGELSKKFLMMFGRINDCVISLDTVTNQLGVERRRIYDIINILESLGVVYRKGKNNYQWRGLRSIHHTITKLKNDSSTKKETEIINDDSSSDEDDDFHNRPAKKEKSLGLLSTGFIRLFFAWKDVISLEQAARKLSSETIEDNKIKTKIRRLYDIANVFSALGLIKKTSLDSKKPAFQWIGLSGLDKFIERLNASQDEKDIFMEKASQKSEYSDSQKLSRKSSGTIQSQHSAFKQPAVQKPIAIEDLLFLIKSLQSFSSQESKERVQKPLSQETVTTLPHTLAPSSNASDEGSRDFATPNIRKTVSILQKNGPITDMISPEKKKSIERNLFKDRTNAGFLKRSYTENLHEFENSQFKKVLSNVPSHIKPSVDILSQESSSEPLCKENSRNSEIKVESLTQ